MLDLKNVDIVVGIPLIFCLRAQTHAIEVERSPSLIVPLPVWSHGILICLNGKLDPENIGIAVGISLISCLEVEINAFEFMRPPSWITHFRFGCTVSELVSLECWTPKTWNFVDILSGSGETRN